MQAVVLFSHGSLLCGAGEALKTHTARLRERHGMASVVEIGYLNYSSPPFQDAVATCVAAGATEILAAPYFLVPGKFVKVDLPREVEAARGAFPSVTFTIAEPIGYDELLADALIESAHAASPDGWRDNLKRAQAACRPDPQCPLYNSPLCPKHPGDDAPRLGD